MTATRWTVRGIDYVVQWAHPQTIATVHRGQTLIPVDPATNHVLIPHDSVPKGEFVDRPDKGSDDAIAKAAVRAVGDVIANQRIRIEFLRLAREYPFGMDPDALGLDGGGDPRAHPNQQDKAPDPKATGGNRINQGHLLQPGAFPGDPVGGDSNAAIDLPDDPAAAALAQRLTGVAKAALQTSNDPNATPEQRADAERKLAAFAPVLNYLPDGVTQADLDAATELPPLGDSRRTDSEQTAEGSDGNPGDEPGAPNAEPATPQA